MKKSIYKLLALLVSFLFISCNSNGNDDLLDITTDNTLAVVKLNLENFEKKFPIEKMLKDSTRLKFSEKEKEKAELLLNAEKNGIDIDKPAYIIVDSDKNKLVSSFVLWIADKNLFQTNFSKIVDRKVKIDGKSFLYAGETLIGTVKDDMLVMSTTMENPINSSYGVYNRAPENVSEVFYKEFWDRKKTENEELLNQIDQSLKKDMDSSAWFNIHGFVSLASKGYIETLAINKLLLGSGFAMNVNFEEGQIVANSETYFNDEMKEIVKKYYKDKNINYEILKSIDVDKAKSFMIGYISLDFVKYFIKEAGFEATINNVLASRDISLEEIVNGFTGDYAFVSFGDVKQQVYDEFLDYTYEKVTPNFAFVLGKNGAKGTKIVDQFRGDYSLKDNIFYTNKDLFVLANDPKSIELLQNKKTAENKKLDEKSGITSYSWTSGEELNLAMSKANSPSKAKIVSVVSESKMNDGNASGQVIISFDKKDKNAISYLMGYE